MATKKGAQIQLQAEINNEEDWEKLLEKQGLIVVDIYSEWCGPCLGMVSNLKKLKLEIGGDNLQLAIAKADGISCLKRFRQKSEPTWMFISQGKMVNLIFGTNAPKLVDTITKELELELEAQKGNIERTMMEFTDLMPEEKERLDIIKAEEEEAARIEYEAILAKDKEKHTILAEAISQEMKDLTVVLFWPHVVEAASDFIILWEPLGLQISTFTDPTIDEDTAKELFYFSSAELSETALEALCIGPAYAIVLKVSDPETFEGNIEEITCKGIYGESGQFPGDPESPAEKWIRLVEEIWVEEEEEEEEHVEAEVEAEVEVEPEIEVEVEVEVEEEEEMTVEQAEEMALERERELEGVKEIDELIFDEPAVIDEEQYDEILAEIQQLDEIVEEEEEEQKPKRNPEEKIPGIWTPEDPLSKAMAMKVLFASLADPFVPEEKEPIPPCIIFAFETFKRAEVYAAMEEFKSEIHCLGFFTSSDPKEATLICKKPKQYEARPNPDINERLVMQVMKKRSHPILTLAALRPIYVSPNTVEGDKEAKLFFPEDYNLDVESVETIKKRKRRRPKGSKVSVTSGGSEVSGEEESSEITLGEEEIITEEGQPSEEGEQPPTAEQPETTETAPESVPEGTQPPTEEGQVSETAPSEAVPAESAPTESAPAESAPAESAPAETAPTETAPTETAPDAPTEAAPATTESAPAENPPPTPESTETTNPESNEADKATSTA